MLRSIINRARQVRRKILTEIIIWIGKREMRKLVQEAERANESSGPNDQRVRIEKDG